MGKKLRQTADQCQPLIIYDGVCYFCNRAVQFIIDRDPTAKFRFAPMQSALAQQKIESHCPGQLGIDTFILIKEGHAFIWSSAALEILKDLDSGWRWLGVLKYIPVRIRDFCYQLFARNRYRVFGRSEVCVIPDQAVRGRFLGMTDE